jgi:phage tail sheath protein FI
VPRFPKKLRRRGSYKTPAVYVEEISTLPASIAEVASAVPAFIGYTEKADDNGSDLTNQPTAITSLLEFTEKYGGAYRPQRVDVQVDAAAGFAVTSVNLYDHFHLYNAIQHYFDNGGGRCYVVSVAPFIARDGSINPVRLGGSAQPDQPGLLVGLQALMDIDEVTLLLSPDAVLLPSDAEIATLQQQALAQCAQLRDRFAIFDLREKGRTNAESVKAFRNGIGTNALMYGAAYTPWLRSSYRPQVPYSAFRSRVSDGANELDLRTISTDTAINQLVLAHETALAAGDDALVDATRASLYTQHPAIHNIVEAIQRELAIVPPSGAMAGIYARVDRNRGVCKAPANESVNSTVGPTTVISDAEQGALNIDATSGKSINAIRTFTGKGVLVWGARTLAGNDNEWRYVSVRRLFSVVEESVKKSTQWTVFEPNDANTWVRVKSSIENYLLSKWRDGALMGAKADEALYVNVGLGQSMTAQDLLEGRLIVEIGMAPVRPAEFIVLRFEHRLSRQ